MPTKNLTLLVISLLVLLVEPTNVSAQNYQPSLELGAQFSGLYQNNSTFFSNPPSVFLFDDDPGLSRWDPGIGGRAGYNLNRFLAIDTEVNFFPKDNAINGRIIEGLAGAKIGLRRQRVGIFGKVRPGFLHMGKSLNACGITLGDTTLCRFDKERTDWALDVGGVLELYRSGNWFVRFDLGDTVQFFRGHKAEIVVFTPVVALKRPSAQIALDSRDPFDERPHTYHNLQFSIGISFRF